MNEATPRVVIGMDPHKRSVTIEVMTSDGTILAKGRFGTDLDGHAAMRRHVRAWPDRVWAIEGCQGIGRHVANRLLAHHGRRPAWQLRIGHTQSVRSHPRAPH